MNFEIKVNVELGLNEETKKFLTQLFGNKSMLLNEETVPDAIENSAPPLSMELPKTPAVINTAEAILEGTPSEIVKELTTQPATCVPAVTKKLSVKEFENLPEVVMSGIKLKVPTIMDARSANGIRVHWECVYSIEDTIKYIVGELIKQRPNIRVDSHTALTGNNLLWIYSRFNAIPKRDLNWKGWIYKNFPETAKEYNEMDANVSFVDPVPSVTKKEQQELKPIDRKEEDVKPAAKKVPTDKKDTPVNEIAGIRFELPMTKTLKGEVEFKWDEMGANVTDSIKKIIIAIANQSDIDVFSGAILSRRGFGSVVGKFYTLKTIGVIDSNVYWHDFVRETLEEKTK